MPHSQRIKEIYISAEEKGINQPLSTFLYDMHYFGNTTYANLEKWEKIARSMADAIVKQKICINKNDCLIGRIYHSNEKAVIKINKDFDYNSKPYEKICKEVPGYSELLEYQLCGSTLKGHVAWAWDEILRLGTSGLKSKCAKALAKTTDVKSQQFYNGVLIMLEALEAWNDEHIKVLKKLGMNKMVAICSQVPKFPARTFHEAVQAFFMQYIIVMRENPFGGNSPGRLDYYLWPYLENDLANGICTLSDAREIIDELFIRINERIYMDDTWVEVVTLGGSHTNGTDAVNPLSYIMIESIMELEITHPSVYIRLTKNSPPDFLNLCAKYMTHGSNRAQLFSDETIIGALTESGVPLRDAVEYISGGCMEIGLQGMTSDFLFNGWWNTTKLVEICVTGGICLKTGNRLSSVNLKGLEHYKSYDDFYDDFLAEAKRLLTIFFRAQDTYSEEAEFSRPSYLISSMIQDCMAKGRNMHGGGARYHDYGSTPIGLPNAADYLYAIKKAVFDNKICSAAELISALKANFKGYEDLRKRLINIPKYGQENNEADSLMAKLCADISEIYTSDTNRFGGTGKIIVMTFIWAAQAGSMLGATADGNLAGKPVAQGITPQSSSMTKGITAAMNSCFVIPQKCFNGGASTMWDLDYTWATEDIIQALFTTFIKNGGQIYQGNVTDVNELINAQQNPEEYANLIVRVGGFSARFISLDKELQDDIITRIRHRG